MIKQLWKTRISFVNCRLYIAAWDTRLEAKHRSLICKVVLKFSKAIMTQNIRLYSEKGYVCVKFIRLIHLQRIKYQDDKVTLWTIDTTVFGTEARWFYAILVLFLEDILQISKLLTVIIIADSLLAMLCNTHFVVWLFEFFHQITLLFNF